MADLTKLAIKQVLETATAHKWSLQGMGMFRLYLSREVRLHVWDGRFTVERVSTLHTHPWDFTSHVLSGCLTDRKFKLWDSATATGAAVPNYYEQKIVCGPGGGVAGEKTPVHLSTAGDSTYHAGHTYSHAAADVHETVFKSGTVTLLERVFGKDTEHAMVYFRLDREWVSAEPRDAKPEEVEAMARVALDRWEP